MNIGLDTNIVVRNALSSDPRRDLVTSAIARLVQVKWQPVLVPQVVVEFWSVAARPTSVNGIGWTAQQARTAIDAAIDAYTLLPYPTSTISSWLAMCDESAVLGRQAHDAHLAATLLEAGVSHLLTLNPTDFNRFPNLTVVTPDEVLAGALDHVLNGTTP